MKQEDPLNQDLRASPGNIARHYLKRFFLIKKLKSLIKKETTVVHESSIH